MKPFALTRRPWLLLLVVLPGTAAYFGVQFDVAWHIDYGRDHFSIPPHLVILAGVQLGGLALASLAVWTTTLARRGSPLLTPMGSWRGIPVSPLLLVALACFVAPGVVLGLDEGWHRIFGLDVSAWSPTHLTALYTAATTGLATTAFLAAELNQRFPDRAGAALRRLREAHPSELWLVYTLGLFGAGLLVMLIEYDFDVPQQSLTYAASLLAALTAFPVFAGMAALGLRFGATLVGAAIVGFKLASVLGLIALGRTHPDLPASIVIGALAADAVVLAAGRRRGAVVAALAVYPIVLVGCEWLRLELLDQPQWTDGLWPLGAPLAIPAAMAVGALGLRVGWALRPVAEPDVAPSPVARRLARRLVPAGIVVLVLLGPAVPAALGAIYTRDVVLSRLEISPAHPAPGDTVRVRVLVGEHSIRGDRPPFLDTPRRKLGAFRADERLHVPLRRTGPRSFEGRVRLDKPGKWVVWPEFKLPDKRWIDRVQFEVLPGAHGGGTHAEQIALGPEADPDNAPNWLKPFGFAVMLAIWGAVTLAIVRALRVVARFGFGEVRA